MSNGLDESVTISGFELLTKLSSGGMGDVLLARRRGVHGFEKLVAVKTIRGELTKRPDIRAMFLDEARLSARLDHPNIAQVYDFGEEDGTLFLAMEYVPGIALNKLLAKRGGPLPPAVAARVIGEVCRGLHAAHELRDLDGTLLGVVHRDVSPGNLILTFDGRMKILDFGIAFMKGRESPDTHVGELKGKPSYMAPEHLRAQGVDRRADIYSASVVLHELLTGRKLFTRETVVATVLAVESQPVPTPSSIAGALPAGLDEIVMHGLERKAVDRFPDARMMAAALDRIVAETAGETLESFVDAELSFEREAHRQWLHSVLSGLPSAPTWDSEPAPASRATSQGRPRATAALDGAEHTPRSGSRARAATPPEGSHGGAARRSTSGAGALARSTSTPPGGSKLGAISPLVDQTTLVPPGADGSGAVSAVESPGRRRAAFAGLIVLCFVAAFLGYRVAFEDSVVIVPARPPEREVAALPPRVEEEPKALASSTTAAVAEVVAEEVTDPTPPPKVVEPAHRPEKASPKRQKVVKADTERPAPGEEDDFGYVTIGAQPYALVRIDGQEVGVTPIMRRKLSAGPHEIWLVSPENGEVRLKRTVKLADGEHIRVTLP